MNELTRVTRGVWRRPDEVADLAGRCAAVLNAAPRGAVLAGLAAAELHGLWLPGELATSIEVILRRGPGRPSAQAGTRRAELRGRRRVLMPDEIAVVHGLPVTSEARTWVDLAEAMTLADLVAAGDSVLRGNTGRRQLTEAVRRAVGRRGVVRARTALALLHPGARSRPESHLRVALVTAGLPTPSVNEPIFDDAGQWLAEPDLHYAEAKLALEYNGVEHAQPARMRRDITRDIDVHRRGGWRIVTFGPQQVFGRPDQTASYVRELLGELAPGLLRRAA